MENRLRSSDYRHSNSFYTAKSGLITTVAQGGEEEDVRRSFLYNVDQEFSICQAIEK
jgi:hypothetical protein